MQPLKIEHLLDVNSFCEWVSGEKQACIHKDMQDAAQNNRRLVLWAPPEFGKSRQITFRRLAWIILNNPNIRIGIVGSRDVQSQDLLRGTAQVLREAINKGGSAICDIEQLTANRLLVTRSINEPEPTIQCIGISGNFLGARLDLIIIDDAVKFEDSFSQTIRERKYQWIISSMCMGRLLPHARIWVLGNTWHPDDAMHRLVDKHGFKAVRIIPARDQINLSDPLWPEFFPTGRLLEKRRELGSTQFDLQYFHQAINLENQRFKSEWLEAAFERGKNLALEYTFSQGLLIGGLDWGVGQDIKHDETARVILSVDKNVHRRLVWVEGGRYKTPEVRDMMSNDLKRYPGIAYRVEHAGQQGLITPILQEAGISVTPHKTTAASKNDLTWGIEALAVKFEAGQYTLPGLSRDNIHVQKLIQQALYYTPQDHPGDYLMALWIADCACAGFSGGWSSAPPRTKHFDL